MHMMVRFRDSTSEDQIASVFSGAAPERKVSDELMSALLIDDQRNLTVNRVARTYKEGIEALREQHWDLLYLDHDLGDFSGAEARELTGYDVARWLEANPEFLPDRIEIITSNPAGRRDIELALQ
jgi:CheY-like chemotaxis protein